MADLLFGIYNMLGMGNRKPVLKMKAKYQRIKRGKGAAVDPNAQFYTSTGRNIAEEELRAEAARLAAEEAEAARLAAIEAAAAEAARAEEEHRAEMARLAAEREARNERDRLNRERKAAEAKSAEELRKFNASHPPPKAGRKPKPKGGSGKPRKRSVHGRGRGYPIVPFY